jgi:hypothetical protein
MSQTLFVGHSLVGQVMPTMFNSFMESQNLDMQADAQVINGAPLRYNWDNGASAEGVNAREVLTSGDYDTVIVTEAIPLEAQIQENDSQSYALRYADLAQSANADTQFYLYETWHEIGSDTHAWRAQIENDLPKWQGIIDHVNNNAADGAPEALVLPAGQAMGRLHDRIEAGDVPGVTSIRELFSDDIHLNDTGNWFIAALHASAVTGVDVGALPLETYDVYGVPYGGPDAAFAEVMADVIDDTLDDFLQQVSPAPFVPVAPAAPVEETDDNTPDTTVWNDDTLERGVLIGESAGGAGNEQLSGDARDNILLGGSGDDTLFGGSGHDSLTGSAGNDAIVGDGGNDVLTLGDGSDTVSGGDGDDVFVLTGLPGSVLITDFGANGAQDMIDLSAISGYDSFADVAATASFPGADTVLTLAVPNGVLTVTIHSDNPLTSSDFGLPSDPNGITEIVPKVDPVDQGDPSGLTYTIEGADSGHFVVDPVTGDIGNQPWFEPAYDQVWDISGDRVYEVERIGSNLDGEEVSRTFFELETTSDGVVWREVDGEANEVDPVEPSDPTDAVDPTKPVEDGTTFFLEGSDAYHFVIDPESGEIDNISWFDPSYDQIWDTSGDRIYESERYALAEDGTEISREALEMETTLDGVAWRVVSSAEDGEMSGAEIMNALALAPANEEDVPVEPEDSDDEVLFLF